MVLLGGGSRATGNCPALTVTIGMLLALPIREIGTVLSEIALGQVVYKDYERYRPQHL